MNNDQYYIDQLYALISAQRLRYNHFYTIIPQPSTNSVWNRTSDEKSILDKMIDTYKGYYRSKCEELKTKFGEMKEYNTTSYLTYDADFYINEYNDRMEEINKYLVDLENKTIEETVKDDLTKISKNIDLLFCSFIADPQLRNHSLNV